MSTVSRGNKAELAVAHEFEEEGWVVGSRRHIGGAGDLICVKRRNFPFLMLIEVKSTQKPFDHFGPKDRIALVDLSETIEAVPVLAWRRGEKTKLFYLHDWPKARRAAVVAASG